MSNHRQTRQDTNGFDLLLVSAIIGLLFLVFFAALSTLTPVPTSVLGLVFVVVYIAVEAVICLYSLRRLPTEVRQDSDRTVNTMMSEVIRSVEFPVVITTTEGKMIWANASMVALCGTDRSADLSGQSFQSYCGVPVSDIITASKPEGVRVEMGGRSFIALSYLMATRERDYWMTVLDDRTELDEAVRELDRESPAVAYIALDNLEELAQYMRVSYRSAANEIEGVLRTWTEEMGGFIREYDRDKYLMVFSKEKLAGCVASGFDILDRIREVGLGDGSMSVTVSMGVSVSGDSFGEKEKDAASALETALQRGGDQVALRTGDGMEFFGGRTKIQQKRTKVRSRVIADRLIQLISDAGNVLIMGHKNPDFDAIGACVGLARLAMGYNPNVKIVTDLGNPNFRICTAALLREVPEYSGVFVGADAGMDLIRTDTLLIIVDVNNLKIVEAPDIVNNVFHTVIIDHHRKIADFDPEPEITYIEPSASSTCELVSEILELTAMGSAVPEGARITRHEANILLSGIMLDTKNFTRTTGERTFSAALYLREAGASSELARTFFFYDLSGFVTESKLGSNVRLYRDRIAMTVCDGAGTSEDRIAASKTADTLLTVKQVDAAFVLLRTDDAVIISARSNGSINVQLILEKIGGGGHFDAAGAQLKNVGTQDVMERLKKSIDEYLDGNEA